MTTTWDCPTPPTTVNINVNCGCQPPTTVPPPQGTSALHDPYWFGAEGGGEANDHNAMQAWVNWHQDNDKECEVPNDSFNCGSGLLQTKFLKWGGAGKGMSKLICTSADGPALLAQVPVNGPHRDWEWSGFSLVPASPMATGHGMVVALTGPGAFLNRWKIHNIDVGPFGASGLVLDNAIHNTDGIFCGELFDCWVQDGIVGVNLGDSIHMHDFTSTGRNTGLDLSGVAGARQLHVHDANITNRDGGIALRDVEQALFGTLQLENPGYDPDNPGYGGLYDAYVYLHNCYGPTFDHCTINPNNVPVGVTKTIPIAAVALDGTTQWAEFKRCDVNKGSMFHFNAGPGVVDTKLRALRYYGATPTNSGTFVEVE